VALGEDIVSRGPELLSSTVSSVPATASGAGGGASTVLVLVFSNSSLVSHAGVLVNGTTCGHPTDGKCQFALISPSSFFSLFGAETSPASKVMVSNIVVVVPLSPAVVADVVVAVTLVPVVVVVDGRHSFMQHSSVQSLYKERSALCYILKGVVLNETLATRAEADCLGVGCGRCLNPQALSPKLTSTASALFRTPLYLAARSLSSVSEWR
jgi:hypothetical protein